MMRSMVHFHDQAKKTILESSGDTKITWAIIYNKTKDLFHGISDLKFEVFFPLIIKKRNPNKTIRNSKIK